jgi:hypothetical protein
MHSLIGLPSSLIGRFRFLFGGIISLLGHSGNLAATLSRYQWVTRLSAAAGQTKTSIFPVFSRRPGKVREACRAATGVGDASGAPRVQRLVFRTR